MTAYSICFVNKQYLLIVHLHFIAADVLKTVVIRSDLQYNILLLRAPKEEGKR